MRQAIDNQQPTTARAAFNHPPERSLYGMIRVPFWKLNDLPET